MKGLKKLLAYASIWAIMLMNGIYILGVSPASAAVSNVLIYENWSGTITSNNVGDLAETFSGDVTVSFTTAASVGSGSTVTIVLGWLDTSSLTWGSVWNGYISNMSWATAALSVTWASTATIVFTSTTALAADTYTFTLTWGLINTTASTWAYRLSVTTPNEAWASLFYVANPNVVSVTALVEPILSFALSANTMDFGILSTSTVNTNYVTWTISTNAQWWAVVLLSVTWNSSEAWLYDTASSNVIQTTTWTLVAGWTEWMWIYVSSTGATTINWAFAINQANTSSWMAKDTATTMATVWWPVNAWIVVVKTDVWISNITQAGSYSSTYTFTVTTTF